VESDVFFFSVSCFSYWPVVFFPGRTRKPRDLWEENLVSGEDFPSQRISPALRTQLCELTGELGAPAWRGIFEEIMVVKEELIWGETNDFMLGSGILTAGRLMNTETEAW